MNKINKINMKEAVDICESTSKYSREQLELYGVAYELRCAFLKAYEKFKLLNLLEANI